MPGAKRDQPIQPITSCANGSKRETNCSTATSRSCRLNATKVIDVSGRYLLPGLIDSHVHPVFGDWTPRQNQIGWIDSTMHGGVTAMVSAGEVHLPGRPKTDRLDAVWLCKVAERQMLRPSFVPRRRSGLCGT